MVDYLEEKLSKYPTKLLGELQISSPSAVYGRRIHQSRS